MNDAGSLPAGGVVSHGGEVGGVNPTRLSSPTPSASAPSAASHRGEPMQHVSCRVRVRNDIAACSCVIAVFGHLKGGGLLLFYLRGSGFMNDLHTLRAVKAGTSAGSSLKPGPVETSNCDLKP